MLKKLTLSFCFLLVFSFAVSSVKAAGGLIRNVNKSMTISNIDAREHSNVTIFQDAHFQRIHFACSMLRDSQKLKCHIQNAIINTKYV